MEECDGKSTPIREFYRGTNVFITGCTGFMGKVLVEKLLRSCPHIAKLFLMLRSKKGKDWQTRLDETFQDVIFDRLKKEVPDYQQKITIVSGDCQVEQLGLSSSDRRLIIEEVHIVFHVAATVKFDEKLNISFNTNAKATEDILDLAHEMKKLKALLLVSTAFSNCHLPDIEEKLYSYPYTYNNMKAIVNSGNDKILNAVTKILLEDWPNTYTFTKAIAEDLLRDKGIGLPVGVFRPAIGVGTYKEPIPGWIDNFNGPTAAVVGAFVGILRTFYANESKKANVIPVDMSINALIASAWDIANRPRPQSEDDIRVYNYVSVLQNPVYWGSFMNTLYATRPTAPSIKTVWYPYGWTTSNRFLYLFIIVTMHFLPAAILDGILFLTGKKPMFVKLYKKAYRYNESLAHFGLREWNFTNNNVLELHNKLDEDDKSIFYFDFKDVDWNKCLSDLVIGARVHLIKDDLSTVPQAKTRLRRLFIADLILKIILASLLFWALYTTYH
ncbi:fatty acyl-CoA reductase wat-like [Periplaneta americana]|uniref:fatty acyl-CoA reductase wat-like n=1 Tax=Periplaneta americana TaxID=6978 RepID=UPI0037E899F0